MGFIKPNGETVGTPETDEAAYELLEYEDQIQRQAAQGVYRGRRAQGHSILEALEVVFRAIAGETD